MKENYLEELFSLKGKVALVTGAGRGIGQVIARDLARAGADIAIFSRSGAADTVKLIEEEGGKALDIIADCTKEDQVTEGFKKILEVYGRIDVVVNNAGVWSRSSAGASISTLQESILSPVRPPAS